jgi:hypothetical protein
LSLPTPFGLLDHAQSESKEKDKGRITKALVTTRDFHEWLGS